MEPAATIADDDIGMEVQRILAYKKPQLLAEFKKVDFSGLEPSSAQHLKVALLKQYIRQLLDSQTLSSPCTSPSQAADSEVPGSRPVITSPSTASPSKSHKQAVTASQSLTPSAPDSNQVNKRLAELEVKMKDHQHKIQALDRKAEELERRDNQLKLVLYNVPELPTQEEDDDEVKAVVQNCIRTDDDMADIDVHVAVTRLGKRPLEQDKPRPAVVRFDTQDERHLFLKYANVLKSIDVKYDDFLSRQQQKERRDLLADFQALKSKGYTPFYRGSVLKYRHAEKTRNCRLGQALKAPKA